MTRFQSSGIAPSMGLTALFAKDALARWRSNPLSRKP